ncbi:MAG: TetR/AcrR family transcriptional regulator [Terriglobales bacterium]
MLSQHTPAKQGTEERILEAAAQLFSRQGFNGTSTRAIARLADVNETTLFRYFVRKRDLFWAVIASRLQRVRMRRELQNSLASDADLEEVLPMIFEFLVQTVQYQPELMRLLYFSALELRPAAERICKDELGPIFAAISGYLERCVQRSAMRAVDPLMTMLGFMTMVAAHHALYPAIYGTALPYSTEEAISVYSDFWLGALTPPRGDGKGSGVADSRGNPQGSGR